MPSLEKDRIEILDWKVLRSTDPISVRIMYAGGRLTDKAVQIYVESLGRSGFSVELRFYKTNVTKEDLENMTAKEIDLGVSPTGTLLVSEPRMHEIDQSIRAFFPELTSVAVGNVHHPVEGGGTISVPVIVLERGPRWISPTRRREVEEKILRYMNGVAGKAAYEVLWAN